MNRSHPDARPAAGARHACAILALLLAVPAQAAVVASDAWVGEVPPVSDVAAAYLTLVNTGTQPVTLDAVTSPQAGYVMWHEVRAGHGMHQAAVVRLAPGQRVRLAPAGTHLMLMDLKGPLRLGDPVRLQFRFVGAPALTVDATVRRQLP